MSAEISGDKRARSIQEVVERCIRHSPALQQARKMLSAFAPLTRPVLVRGELATVRALLPDVCGDRAPVVAIDCGLALDAADGQMLTSALLPHRRTLVRGGVLVLLEIDHLGEQDRAILGAMARQSVIDERGTELAARLICQTDPRSQVRPLEIQPGVFLEVDVLSLNERSDDAVSLVGTLLTERLGAAYELSAEAASALAAHNWPADVSELIVMIERLEARKSLGELRHAIDPADLGLAAPSEVRPFALTRTGRGRTLKELVSEFEAEVIRETMVRLRGNKTQAAKELGISRSYLIAKCQEYGVE